LQVGDDNRVTRMAGLETPFRAPLLNAVTTFEDNPYMILTKIMNRGMNDLLHGPLCHVVLPGRLLFIGLLKKVMAVYFTPSQS
jgi:hypothetical protein